MDKVFIPPYTPIFYNILLIRKFYYLLENFIIINLRSLCIDKTEQIQINLISLHIDKTEQTQYQGLRYSLKQAIIDISLPTTVLGSDRVRTTQVPLLSLIRNFIYLTSCYLIYNYYRQTKRK